MCHGLNVINTSELERFQRWLQSELANASLLDDKDDRERRTLQIELAISEVMRYREILSSLDQSHASPFVEREESVRVKNNSEVKPVTKSGECHSCGAEKLSDLQFCPICGEF
tara:strand:+ start:475 stop:813 length:339 start_codon:yes stop_codon:yes gene_type:complete